MIFRFNDNVILSVGNWSWEKDYFFHIISKVSGKKIYVFSSNYTTYTSSKMHVTKFRPDIIIHFSDEFGTKKEYDELSKLTKIYFRQHFHKEYPNYNNKFIMPLGYQTGMFDALPIHLDLKTVSERKLKWSFIGDFVKNIERRDMVNHLSSIGPHRLGKADPRYMKEIYCDSVFVPNVRGDVKLDCFRLYEATSCGAIPILVGPILECRELIKSQEMPPWPYFDNWQDAKHLMENYNPQKLQVLQDKNIAWWNSRLEFIIDKIKE